MTQPIDATRRDTIVWPTTPLQQAFVALAGTRPEDPYTGQAVVRIDGPLPVGVLQRAVDGLVADEPQLHAGFVVDADLDPVQFVEPGTPARFRTVVLDDLADLDTGIARTRADDLARGFDLDDPPLVRWTHVVGGDASALVVTAHHAVLDAWSMPLLTGEIARRLADLTGQLAGGGTDVPAPPAARYADHLGWLSAQDAPAAQEFWAGHLAHATDRTAPGVRRGAGRRSHATVRPSQGVGWDGLTAADRVRTCWGLAVDAVTGGHGTPFAVPVSGRNPEVPGVDTAIGLFTDSVLVADVHDPEQDLGDAVRAGADRWRSSLPHHHVGMRGILRALRSGELATSLVTVENPTEPPRWRVGPTTVDLVAVEDDTHYPLALTVRPGRDAWTLDLDHDAAGEHLARRLLHAVAAFLAAAPTERIAAVDALAPFDAETLQRNGNGPHRADPVPALLPARWADVATRCADHDLLVHAGPAGELSRQTGAELDRAVTALRHEVLAALPTDGGRVVAVSVPRGSRSVEAVLAVVSAGASVLVLDPALPDARRRDVLTGAGAVVLVGPTGVEALHDEPRGAAVRIPGPDDVAAVVLTSGSTGLPKPVAVPHRALAHLCARQLSDLHPVEPVQVAHTASFHFDAQWDALLALFGGHTVHVLAEDLFLDPFALAAYVREHAIAYLDLTPTVWSALLSADAFAELPAVCVVGGEAFGTTLWTRMRGLAARTGARVLNLYGPTEATVDAFAAAVTDAAEPVVGTPVGATGALVLDDWLRPVPPGTDGELYLAGPQLAHGYLGQPGRTAERFVANPFPARVPGDRLYRTGDRARWDDLGRLLVSGRTDDQISLHGVRIEPGEVEHVLLQHPDVTRAVVLAPEVGRTGRRLVAWVVRTGPATPDEVRSWCRDRLPAHLVPRDVLFLDDLPLTPNGKLDRTRLPLPGTPQTAATTGVSDDAAFVAVRDALAAVLGVRAVGDTDDFFVLGGDSISAIQVTARLRTAGWLVRPGELLAARTPAAIARLATREVPVEAPAGAGDLVVLDPAVRAELAAHVTSTVVGNPVLQDVWPLTPTQLGIHVDAQRTVPDPYRTTALLRLDDPDGVVDEKSVRDAVAGWFARHPALRLGVWQGPLPEPVTFLPDRLVVPFDVVDTADASPEFLDRLQRDELDRPTDASAARLAGVTWVRVVGSATSWLVVSLHHLLADGWSMPVLAEELRQELRGGPVPSQERGFVDHLRRLGQVDLAAFEEFWTQELRGARPTLLGGGATADATRTVRRATTLDATRTAAVRTGVRERGATPAAAAQAAWAAVLAARTGNPDVCWALTSAGRGADVPDRAVGMFVTTRTVRARTGPDLLRAVGDATARSEEAAVLGLGRIERATGRFADTLVVVENYPTPPTGEPGVSVSLVEGRDATTFPVTVTAFPGVDFRLEIEVDPELLAEDAGVADELLTGWVTALEALAAGEEPVLDVRRVDGPVMMSTPMPAPMPTPKPTTVPHRAGDRTERAQRIAAVVAEVLGTPVGVVDDFFTAGGDSISAVRLVGALRTAGIVVGIADVFTARTPAGLDAVAGETPTTTTPGHGGPLVTPALAWFGALAASDAELRGFQQLRVVDLPAGTRTTDVARAATELLARHDALRLRIGGTLAVVAPAAAAVEGVEFPDLEAALARVTGEIDHTIGDLLRWVVTGAGTATPRLAIAAHHVAVDAVSWPVLLDELRVLLAGGELPAAPSFTAWTHAQQRAVEDVRDHAAHWRSVLRPARPLVPAPADLGRAGDAVTREVVLDPERSRRFLELAAAGWRPDALLAAALTADRDDDLVVEVEGHGRPTTLPADDPRNDPSGEAVGWFTATWPVRLPAGRNRPHHARTTVRAVLNSATLGPDFGVLRHLDRAHSKELEQAATQNPPQVLLNWLGRDVPAGPEHTPWRTSVDAASLEERLGVHAGLPVSHGWELNAWAVDGPDGARVIARWQVAAPLAAHADAVLDRWRTQLDELLDATGGTAPTAVHDAVGLTSSEFDELSDVPGLQAVWPLSPVQRGMLFHAGDGPDRYTSSVELRLGGALDPARLREALAATVAAHPQLRARIAHVGDRSVLATVADLPVPWTALTSGELEEQRQAELAEPYDLTSRSEGGGGALLRARLLRTGPAEHTLLLGAHHVLLDGWSVPTLVDELLGRYAGTWTGGVEDLVRGPFARALARRPDPAAALARRVELLTPVRDDLTPLLPVDLLTDEPVRESVAELPAGLSAAAARATGTTPAAVVTAAWSLVLAALTGRSTVSPGVVVSGRDERSDTLLGMFIDTVPLLARCGGTVGELVADLATQTAQAGAEPPVGLSALAAELRRAPWIDTLLVVENYPGGTAEDSAAAGGLELREVSGRDGTHYGLALTAEDGTLRLEHQPGVLSPREAHSVLTALTDVLATFTDPATPVAAVLDRADLAEVRRRWDGARVPAATGGPVDTVRSAFADLFGRPVAAGEDFFALGGDSILAMSLVTALRSAGWQVRPSAVFTAPTPERLAALAEPLAAEPAGPATTALIDLDARGTAALDALLKNL